ncbi:hypothetical protein [Vulcanisaeta sp. JCM 16161]|uniref:hypothetical protein n=1 Tax=Vulcanisaeta sp. JCM 16161 TaxID=1295372 RepID=UPI0006D26076|nr:hypothetical protein [Vulcanisaeta sp. JCM 16161]
MRRWVGGNIVSEHVKARPDLYAWLRPWNGELWLYRVLPTPTWTTHRAGSSRLYADYYQVQSQ